MSHESFRELNGKCSAIFQFTRGVRILEIILQASWVDFFNARIEAIGREYPTNTPTENKMAALREAALAFSLSEKAMRNKLAIWQGYKRIKDIGGWPALIFAEDGVYTICKYRVGFKDPALFSSLRDLRAAIELAADTVQPTWRRFLRILQIETTPTYTGHPHTWQIAANGIPVPLSECNYKWIQHYKLIEESVVDMDLWDHDPRRVSDGPKFTCNECGEQQDDDPHNNRCRCFPELYGGIKMPAPVQIFDTGTKANGLVARFEFQQGRAIGEFVGLITRGKVGVDVMEGGGPEPEKKYQISQGKQGNFTRFINHSCMPNCQFERFVWMGLERIIAVALRTVEAGKEVTVDYSGVYWDGLEKICKCGEPCCRYSKPRTVSTSS
ncbi:SET domain protein [Pyronema domesticum]|nr:SET domain protein [Pyronema domesticum]